MPNRNEESPPVKITHGPASIAGLVGIIAAIAPLLIDEPEVADHLRDGPAARLHDAARGAGGRG
jgi:hypothetical protein